MRNAAMGLYAFFKGEWESVAPFIFILLAIIALAIVYHIVNFFGRLLFKYDIDDEDSGCVWFIFVVMTAIGFLLLFFDF